MEQVDDEGGEEPGDQGQDVGQLRVATAQPLLQPDVAVVPDSAPVRHNTRTWSGTWSLTTIRSLILTNHNMAENKIQEVKTKQLVLLCLQLALHCFFYCS